MAAARSKVTAQVVEMLLNHRTLTVEDPHVVLVALEQFRKRPRLGFSDCLVLEVAWRAGHTPLGTFDRDLGKLAGVERLWRTCDNDRFCEVNPAQAFDALVFFDTVTDRHPMRWFLAMARFGQGLKPIEALVKTLDWLAL